MKSLKIKSHIDNYILAQLEAGQLQNIILYVYVLAPGLLDFYINFYSPFKLLTLELHNSYSLTQQNN